MQVLKCTKRLLDPKWVDAEVARISEIFLKLSPQAVFLFGSASEGRMSDQSDFDFLILFKSGEEIRNAQKSLRPFYPLSDTPVDILWLTQDEFDSKKDVGGVCFIVAREGRCLLRRGVDD